MHHMSAEEFRRAGREAVDWLADYMERLGDLPVAPSVRPGEIASKLPARPPQNAEPFDALLADLDRVVLPGVMHWQSPRFFGYFPCNTTPVGVLAEMISAGLNAQGMMWSTSPAYTEIETRCLDWLAELIGLDSKFLSTSGEGGGVIQGTASEASLVAMIVARDRARRSTKAPIERLVAYISEQAHSSLTKAARIAGLDLANLRLVPTDDKLAMRADALGAAIRADVEAGLTPFFVCATVGTTSSTANDPLRPIGEAVARTRSDRAPLWLHVDAAYSGAACVCPEHQWMIDGSGLADSFSFNPHKWLLTTFDCSAFWVERRRDVLDALSIMPEYLRNEASASGAVLDYRDWQIPLGRRFRALKLWWTLRFYGVEGLREHIRHHVRLAETVESWVRADNRFVLAAPRTLSLVCFRLRGDDADARTKRLHERVNASGEAFLSHTLLPDPETREPRYVIRMAIGGTTTTHADIERTWSAVRQAIER